MSDYISRDAFIADKRKQYCADCDRRKGMKNGKLKFCYEIGAAPCRACGIDDMLSEVEDYPAADVRPVVRAHLISHDFVNMGEGRYTGSVECSACGRYLPIPENFCPNCGADMREKSDG